MDLEEWELLSDDGFLVDFHHDDDVVGGKNNSKHRRRRSHSPPNPPKSVFNMNYFICPSPPPPSQKFIKPTDDETPKLAQNQQLVPVPIQLEKPQVGGDILEKIKPPPPSTPSLVVGSLLSGDQENQLPQVFFKKMKENEFVDMKMDSPKSSNSRGGIMLQIDPPGKFQFDDKKGVDAMEIMPISPKMTRTEKEMVVINNNNNNNMDSSDAKTEEEVIINWDDNNNGGLNLWKWSLTGVGALCSIGVAAATICIIVFGNKHHQPKNQKLRFQIYTDDKRIKQVVHHHATRLNDAISAARGVPLNRAHITFGGYYDGL